MPKPKPAANDPRLRPAVSYQDAATGEDWVHLTADTGAHRLTLCGRAATVIGNTINPGYPMCPECMRLAGLAGRKQEREPEQVRLF